MSVMSRCVFRGRVFRARFVLMFLVALSGSLGCVKTAIVPVPADLVVVPGQTVRIESTSAVDLRRVDGQPVDARAVWVAPGPRSVEISFRRRLKNQPLGMEKLALFGTCEISIDSSPGAIYEIHAQLPSSRTESTDTIRTYSTLAVFVRDRDTLEEFHVAPSRCEVLTDCRRINREIVRPPPGVCHEFPTKVP